MLTIMLFTILLTVSDAADAPKFTPEAVRAELSHQLFSRAVGMDGCKSKNDPTTASIILRGERCGQYLLFQECSGRFGYPGGNVDYYPNPDYDFTDVGAALREFREETGFPLEKMIAATANSLKRKSPVLSDFMRAVRISRATSDHQVFLVIVDCKLIDMLTQYPGDGKMVKDLKRPTGEFADEIIKAGWRTYRVGSLAKVAYGKKEGEIVALATIRQITEAGRRLPIMRAGKDGCYMRNLIKASGI